MRVEELIERLESKEYNADQYIVADLWEADDIWTEIMDMDSDGTLEVAAGLSAEDVTDEDIEEIMLAIEDNIDNEIGVNWSFIRECVIECMSRKEE